MDVVDNYTILGGYVGFVGDNLYAVAQIRNLADVVKKQGGAAGGLAMSMVPETVAAKAYTSFRDKLVEGSKNEGVDLDVRVVKTPPVGAPPRHDFLVGAAVGVGAAGAGWALWHYVLAALVAKWRK